MTIKILHFFFSQLNTLKEKNHNLRNADMEKTAKREKITEKNNKKN